MKELDTTFATICVLLLGATVAMADDAPMYRLDGFVPVTGCVSVDLSPDGTQLVAKHKFGEWDEGFRIFDVTHRLWDPADWPLIRECHVSGIPWKVLFDADGETVWTTVYYSGRVSGFDDECGTTQDYSVGSWPVDLIFDDSKRFLCAGQGHPGGNGTAGSLRVIDLWTSGQTSVGLEGQGGFMAHAPMDRFFYMASTKAGDTWLYKFDSVDWSVAGVLPLDGITVDVGISVHPDFTEIYVPSPATDEVLVVDANTLDIVDVLDIESPEGFFIAPSGDHALVTHYDLSAVSFFDLATREVYAVFTEEEIGSTGGWKRRPLWEACGGRVFLPLGTVENSVAVFSSRCPGDFTGVGGKPDGQIDILDLLALLAAWGICP